MSAQGSLPRNWDAELYDWLVVVPRRGAPCLVGTVVRDRLARWADGRTICTSALLTPLAQVRANAVVATRNSRYLLKTALAASRGGTRH